MLSIQQFSRLHSQGDSQLLNDGDRRVSGASLEVADIGAMDARLMGQLFLRPVFFLTQAAKVCSKARNDIHAGKDMMM